MRNRTNLSGLASLASATFPKTHSEASCMTFPMKTARKMCRVALALCLALSLSCISAALQAQPAQATQDTFKTVDDMTSIENLKSGATLVHNTVYRVRFDHSFNTSGLSRSALNVAVNSTAYIYIEKGVTLSVTSTGIYPAIHVPEGATLVVGGQGTLSLTVDNAGSGENGGAGEDGRATGDNGKGGNGGHGGQGGHGGAALIGGEGGFGGAGSQGGEGGSGEKNSAPGHSGNNGVWGKDGENAGKIFILGQVKVERHRTGPNPVSGEGGDGGGFQATGIGDIFSNCRYAGGGGGGGGGSYGCAAEIGGGGGGGGGGAGGGGGGYICEYWDDYGCTYGTGGKCGAPGNSGNGKDGRGHATHYDGINGDGGKGGNGGTAGSNGTCEGVYVGPLVTGTWYHGDKPQWDGSWDDIEEGYYYVSYSSGSSASSATNLLTGDEIPFYDFEESDGKATVTGYHGPGTVLEIPSTYTNKDGNKVPVTAIDKEAFRGLPITQVTIPNSVTSIGSEAFMDCTSLETLQMSENVTTIKSYAFSGCSSLTNITLPSELKTIGPSAFSKCTSLKSIDIPSKVTKIGSEAGGKSFAGCSSLTELLIRGKDTDVETEDIWNGCPLKAVYLWKESPLSPESPYSYNFGNAKIYYWDDLPGNSNDDSGTDSDLSGGNNSGNNAGSSNGNGGGSGSGSSKPSSNGSSNSAGNSSGSSGSSNGSSSMSDSTVPVANNVADDDEDADDSADDSADADDGSTDGPEATTSQDGDGSNASSDANATDGQSGSNLFGGILPIIIMGAAALAALALLIWLIILLKRRRDDDEDEQ